VPAATLAAIATLVFGLGSVRLADAQGRRARPSTSRPVTGNPSKYATFTHRTHGPDSDYASARHLKCNNCHTIPSRVLPDRIADSRKPAIARGYPYHDACFDCHQNEIYRGDRPVICADCHTRVSPRALPRDVYSQFPKQLDINLRQFPAYFPHDKHCRTINEVAEASDAKLCQVSSEPVKTSETKQVSCTKCHQKDARPPAAIAVGGAEKSFTPLAGTFHTSPSWPNQPASAHTSCFECHWETADETKKPSKDNCFGCHRISQQFAALRPETPSSTGTSWFENWPAAWPRRISIKFIHGGGGEKHEHEQEKCITCHAGIANATTAERPPRVPIAACFKCHRSSAPRVTKEMGEEDDDTLEGRNNEPTSLAGTHICTGCHVSAIGKMPPPCSHFRLFGEDYFTVEDFPKSAKQLDARCKK